MIAATIVILAVATSQGLLAVQANPLGGAAAVNVNALCGGKPIDGDLTMDQLSSIAAQLNEGTNCPEDIKSAIVNLEKIHSEHHKDACSKAHVESVYQYFIDNMLDKHTLPKPLQDLILTYCMRTNQVCKANMVEFLTGEANELLKPEDFESVAEFTREGGHIDKVLKTIASSSNAVLPSDLAAVLPEKRMVGKLLLSKEMAKDVKRIKEVCDKRFKPIYTPMVLPTIALSRAGLEYSDDAIKKEVAINEEQSKRLDEFNRIVFLCETMDFVPDEDEHSDIEIEPMEEIEFQPKVKVSMDKVEPLPAGEIEQLREKLKKHELDHDVFMKELFKNILEVIKDRLTPEQAEHAKSALDYLSGFVQCTGSTRLRQICGRGSAAANFVYIFIGTIIAFLMMMMGE